MKLSELIKVAAPFLATDKTPEQLEAAIRAADASMPGNTASSKEIMDRRAKDRKARDEKRAADRKARDEEIEEKRKAEDAKRAADRKARDEKVAADRAARDRDDDPEHTNDAALDEREAQDEEKAEREAEDEDFSSAGDPSTPGGNRGGKPAVDSAEVDRRIAAAVAQTRAEAAALNTALRDVEPILGRVAFDSAGSAYRAALKQLGAEVAPTVPDSALPAMLKLAKDRAAPAPSAPQALDSAGVTAMDKIIPGYSRLK